MKRITICIQEMFRTANIQDLERSSPGQIIIKTISILNEASILKVVREKHQVTYKVRPIRTAADLSIKTLRAKRSWKDVFQVLKETANPDYYTQQNYLS